MKNNKVTRSDEHKKKISEANKGHTYNLGKKHSEETKKKISETAKKNKKGRKVVDTSTGRIYDRVRDAAEDNGVNYNTLKNKLVGSQTNNTTFKYLK